jgi:hypothetical protein
LQRRQPRLFVADLLLELWDAAVLQLRSLRVVAGTLGALDLLPDRVELLFQ